MPTYGYECLECGHGFETVQKISDDPLTKCDLCGGSLKKKIFPVGIVFKGSGFYVNDYAKKAGASEDPGASKPETPPAAVKDAAGSTEPAKTTEVKPTETKSEAPSPPTPATPAASKPAS